MVGQGELASLRKPNEEVAPRAHITIQLSSPVGITTYSAAAAK